MTLLEVSGLASVFLVRRIIPFVYFRIVRQAALAVATSPVPVSSHVFDNLYQAGNIDNMFVLNSATLRQVRML